MDGTLVDSEAYWMAAETDLVESHGGTWTHEQALALVGMGLEPAAGILQKAGVRLNTHEIVDHLTGAVMRSLAEQGPAWRPGAAELLAGLRATGVRCALVTMSLRSMATLVADTIADSPFDVIVAGDDATRPKPYPDAYLQACAGLGIHPSRAVAIEDSPTGVRAAVSAGVATIGVPLMVSLTGTGAHEIWPTLDGRTPSDIAAFHAKHALTASGRA